MKYLLFFVFCICGISSAQVGINTDTPLSTLDINGNLSVKTLVLNGGPAFGATPINDGVYISLVPTSGNVEFILPDPASVPGRMYFLRNISDFHTAQVYTHGGKLIFPKNSKVGVNPLNMPTAGDTTSVILVSDGMNWTYY